MKNVLKTVKFQFGQSNDVNAPSSHDGHPQISRPTKVAPFRPAAVNLPPYGLSFPPVIARTQNSTETTPPSASGSTGDKPSEPQSTSPAVQIKSLPTTVFPPQPSCTPPVPRSIPTRFLLLSDTHNQKLKPPADPRHAFKAPLPNVDVLLHAGDLSCSGKLSQLRVTFDLLAKASAELKLVIAGNHDLTLDESYYRTMKPRFPLPTNDEPGSDVEQRLKAAAIQKEIEEARELWTGEEAREAGIKYLEEGTHCFTLQNGAVLRIYASQYSCEFSDWAFMYPREQDRYNPAAKSEERRGSREDMSLANQASSQQLFAAPQPVPSFPAVDVVMTHGPPRYVLDRVDEGDHVGCDHLARAMARARPQLHVFGHIHEDWGAMKVSWAQGTGTMVDWASSVPTQGGVEQSVVQRGWVGWDGTGGRGRGAAMEGPRKEKNMVTEEKEAKTDESVADNELNTSEEKRDSQDIGNTEGHGHRMAADFLEWGTQTLFVNAAIMNARFQPRNAPWLVDLLLPKASDVEVN